MANRKLVCACGHTIVAATDQEVRRLARLHIDAEHPDLFATNAELDKFLSGNIVNE